MQIPFIVMCASLIAIAALFAITLWQMQNRHKRQREELENDVATLDSQIRSLRDLSSSQSSKIAEYTLTNNKLTDENDKLAENLSIANRTSEMRRKALVEANKRPKVRARIFFQGKITVLALQIDDDSSAPPTNVALRQLIKNKKNDETLAELAKEINRCLVAE